MLSLFCGGSLKLVPVSGMKMKSMGLTHGSISIPTSHKTIGWGFQCSGHKHFCGHRSWLGCGKLFLSSSASGHTYLIGDSSTHSCPPIPPTLVSTCTSFMCQAFVLKIAVPFSWDSTQASLAAFLVSEEGIPSWVLWIRLCIISPPLWGPMTHTPFPPLGCCVVSMQGSKVSWAEQTPAIASSHRDRKSEGVGTRASTSSGKCPSRLRKESHKSSKKTLLERLMCSIRGKGIRKRGGGKGVRGWGGGGWGWGRWRYGEWYGGEAGKYRTAQQPGTTFGLGFICFILPTAHSRLDSH